MNLGLKDVFKPKLFGLFKPGRYNRDKFLSDLIAGIIVGIIALPLAIAFGIASGVTPQQGLITAIVAGFLISFFGGSNFLIGGPTGAFIVIVAGIVAQYGMQGLIIATIMAGVFLVIMGLCKMGAIFKFIPYPIVVGFTSGIALTIFSTQMKDFFGLPLDLQVPAGFIPQWICYFQNVGSINWLELVMSLICLVICFSWSKVTKKIPGSLIALIIGTLASVLLSKFAGLELATIGSKFPELANGLPMPKPVAPQFDYETVKGLVSPAFTIAILCAIESLLAAMVADGATGKHHNSNTELIGQGIANIVTPLFGGIPATGALARTMASINNGGKTPVTGLIHAVVLLLIYLFLMPYAIYIPLSCLAAILVQVAYNMSEWRSFKYLLRGDKSDVAVLLITFFLTVIVDLTVAIEVGVLLAIVLFVRRVMQTSTIDVLDGQHVAATENDEVVSPEDTEYLDIPAGVDVYEINGPFFFGLASRIEELSSIKGDQTKVRIIRMRKVPFIDSTGINNLRNLCERTHKRGVTVILSGVTENVHQSLVKFGVDLELGPDNIFPHIVPALEKAKEIVSK
jgi:SulP family sulfate permease